MYRLLLLVLSLFRRTPSQSFIRTFAEPTPQVETLEDVAQDVVHLIHALIQPIVADIDAALALAQSWVQPSMSDLDWAQVADESLLGRRHGLYVPNGVEFDAKSEWLAHLVGLPVEDVLGTPDIAAMLDAAAPAKQPKERVYTLAHSLGVESKFMQALLNEQFGCAVKSPSSTVTHAKAAEVRAFFATHQDA